MATTKKPAKTAIEMKTIDQMRSDLAIKQNDLLGYKKGHKMGELTNPSIIKVTRKEIARLKTAIRAEELKEKK